MQITKIADLVNEKITAMVYGLPGSGKTTMIGELPGKTLIIDTDRGTSVLAGSTKDISVVRLDDNLKDFFEVLKKLEADCPFDNVCIDSISELQKSMLTVLGREGKNAGIPSMKDYQQVDFKLADICRRLRSVGANLILTAWELQEEIIDENGTKYTRAKPMISGKSTPDTLCGLCDLVGRLVIVDDKDNDQLLRKIVFNAKQSMYAKDRIYKRNACNINELIVK